MTPTAIKASPLDPDALAAWYAGKAEDLYEVLRAADPRAARPDLAAGHEDHPAPEGAPKGTQRLPSLEIDIVRAFEVRRVHKDA